MEKKILTTPISEQEIRSLTVGDTIYVTGILVTGRDAVHQRLIIEEQELPVDLKGKVLYHAGPIVKEKAGGGYELVAGGPTTSMRMEKLEKEFLEKTGARLIIGKGGMGNRTVEACRELGAAHAVFPGGCAVLAAECVEEVLGVEWPDLGMAEAVWILRVKEFGPLVVSIDSKGNSLFRENKEQFRQKKEKALAELAV